jgi:hypothetical protein
MSFIRKRYYCRLLDNAPDIANNYGGLFSRECVISSHCAQDGWDISPWVMSIAIQTNRGEVVIPIWGTVTAHHITDDTPLVGHEPDLPGWVEVISCEEQRG